MEELELLLESEYIDDDVKEEIKSIFREQEEIIKEQDETIDKRNDEIEDLENKIENIEAYPEEAIELLENLGYTVVKFDKMVTQEKLNSYIEFLKQNPL